MRTPRLLLLLAFAACAHVDANRYLVDGVPAVETGYFLNDPILPVSLQPHYRHTIVDRAWTTTPWDVEIDRNGWRNRDADPLPDTVMIGDSVVFGYGVGQDETIVSHLSQEIGRPVYNAGIPGLGPESYAIVLNRFLDLAPQARLIVIGFYGGNDFVDLEDASWDGLSQCAIPKSKIHSAAFAPWFPAPQPPWRSQANWQPDNPADWVAYERIIRGRAVSEIGVEQIVRDRVEKLRNDALLYAQSIAESPCADDAMRAAIQHYIPKMQQREFFSANQAALAISRDLFAKRCHPTDASLAPLDSLFYNAAYNLAFLTARAPKKSINQQIRYVQYVARLKEQPQARPILNLIARVRDAIAAGQIPSPDLQYELGIRMSRAFGTATPEGCDKVELVLTALSSSASAHGVPIVFVNLPSQPQLLGSETGICPRAERHGIPCLDLTAAIRDASRSAGKSFFAEQSHLNELGSALAAERIADWLRTTGRNPTRAAGESLLRKVSASE